MKLRDLMVEMARSVRQYVERALAPIRAKQAELESAIKSIPAGKDGLDGKDADQAMVDAAVAKAVAALPVPKNGKDGIDGKDASQEMVDAAVAKAVAALPVPKNGKDGIDGKDASQEMVDAAVAKAVAALPVPKNGLDGAPGRDAFELDVLPAIDEAKSYPRGTWAKHAGGLWRAAGTTHGMRGWECVVAGLASFSVDLEGERTLVVSSMLSGGEPMRKEIALLHPLDRGVYTLEREYMKGDGVTWAGSWWIAQADRPTDKPGTSDQWRLAVKRGRDGKDK